MQDKGSASLSHLSLVCTSFFSETLFLPRETSSKDCYQFNALVCVWLFALLLRGLFRSALRHDRIASEQESPLGKLLGCLLRHGDDRSRTFAVSSCWRSQPDNRHWPDQALRTDQSRGPGDGEDRPSDADNYAQPSPTYRAVKHIAEQAAGFMLNRSVVWPSAAMVRDLEGSLTFKRA